MYIKSLIIFVKNRHKTLPRRGKCVILHFKANSSMRRNIYTIVAVVLTVLMSGCAHEFNQVYKSTNYQYKYEYSKEAFAEGKYQRAITILQEIVTQEKGRENGQECLYMLSMAEFMAKDYETAAEYFKKYYSSYPKGQYAEQAKYYVGKSLSLSTPEPRLDQSLTVQAIKALQEFIDLYPDSKYRADATNELFALQDKLVRKELYSAQLYYDLGTYFGNCTSGGNNYEACVVTAQNAIEEYPYSKLRENFAVLIMKSKFELAQQSVEAKRLERYQDAEDECYGFLNEYPDSKERATAEKFIERCKKVTGENSSAGSED